MKTKGRTILFRVGAVVLLLIIGGLMMVIGRGHTVYLDNRSIEYNGETYAAPYKVVVTVDGEKVAKLYDKERGMAPCIGQTFKMVLTITEEKGGTEDNYTLSLPLPYSMDNISINLPAYMAGLPESVYLSEFVIQTEESESSEAPVDEFAIMDAEM